MDWKYIAGFFDGEGSISHNGRGYRITIPQTNLEVLEIIKDFCGFGGTISVTKRKSHWKDSWIFYVASQREVYNFLSHIFPYLIVKKRITDNAISDLTHYINEKDSYDKKRGVMFDRAAKLRLKGMSYRKVAKKIGVDWGYLRRILLKRGIH